MRRCSSSERSVSESDFTVRPHRLMRTCFSCASSVTSRLSVSWVMGYLPFFHYGSIFCLGGGGMVYNPTMNDEYLDLVDASDKVIGKKLRSEVYRESLSNFRVVNAFVINSEGKLWVPLRSPKKRIFPSCLDMSMGGHVESGEDYDMSFKRELAEELRIDAEKIPCKFMGHLTPAEGVSAFMQVYEIESDEAPNFNTDDFSEYYWLTPREVVKKIESGVPAKGDLVKLVRRFYL